MSIQHPLDALLNHLAQRIRAQLFPNRAAALDLGQPPTLADPPTPPALLDAVLPPRVRQWPRVWVNDRLGGLDRGGVFATYAVDGHEVRVIARRARDEAEAGRYVAQAPGGPAQRAWRRGVTWYAASCGTVEGDEDPVAGPGDIEALDRFVLALQGPGRNGGPFGPSAVAVVAALGMGTAATLGMLAPARAMAAPSQATNAPVEVTLRPLAGGQAAFYDRAAGTEGDVLVVRDLDMTRPVLVGVEPVERGARLEVALYKFDQREPVRRGQPDADGAFVFAFRTYDEVAIEVKAPQPTAYRAAILVAPPVEPAMPSPFVAPAAATETKTGLLRRAWPGASVVTVVLALVLVRTRRRLARTVLLGLVATGAALAVPTASLVAAGPPYPAGKSSPGIEFRRQLMERVGTRNMPSMENEQRVAREEAMREEERLKSIEGRLDRLKDMAESFEKWGTLVQKLVAAMDAVDKADRLSEKDIDYEPNYAPPGMPRVPAACAQDAKCNACFAPAYDNLSAVRRKLENNRIVLANYTRRMNAIDDAGRGLGSMHGGLGIVYMQNKVDWDQQRQQVAGIYDGRYTALLIDLQAALRGIETCEQTYNNTPGWYDRFGFMYYEFMAARYKRTGNYGV